jgi:xanthine dehydrogenase accessory factor
VLDLIDEILRRLDTGEAVALCAVVEARGSTPQSKGAAMIVAGNGQSLGTLGGGCVEAEVRVRALKMLGNSQEPRSDEVADPERAAHPQHASLYQFKLNHDFGWDDGLLCGGIMDIAIRILCTREDVKPLLEMRETLRRRDNATYRMDAPDEQGVTRSFEIEFVPPPAMVIVGAGHVGGALASLAVSIGFELTVIDDREDYVTAARFPGAKRIVGDIERELKSYRIDAQTYVVLVTRGHRHDGAALAAVIDSPAKYIGMIGSKRKVRTILDELEKAGVAREKLMRVQAPIGLELGAVTPAEIAVSIAAQLIAVRRGVDDRNITSMKMKETDLVRFFERDRLSTEHQADA